MMKYRESGYSRLNTLGGGLTPMVKRLLIATGIVYLLQFIAVFSGIESSVIGFFALTPALVTGSGYIWQIFTYMFLHSTSDPSHFLFNMLGLWMFGTQLERYWGSGKFLFIYILCGLFGGACVTATGLIFKSAWAVPTIGQSGAIYGLIAAYGTIFAEQYVYFYAIIPIKARILTWILIGVAVLYALAGSSYSFPAHMGGLFMGWLLSSGNWKPEKLWIQFRLWKLKKGRRNIRVVDGKKEYIN